MGHTNARMAFYETFSHCSRDFTYFEYRLSCNGMTDPEIPSEPTQIQQLFEHLALGVFEANHVIARLSRNLAEMHTNVFGARMADG